MHAHRRSPPRPSGRLSPARLAGRDRRTRRRRSTRPPRGCAPRWRCEPNPRLRRPPRSCSTATGSTLVALKLDGDALAAERYVATPDRLTIAQPPHRAVPARDRDAARPLRQHPAHGPLPLERHLLHAVRGRRLPPHHLFPRPPRRDGGLHHAHRGRAKPRRRCCSPTAIWSTAGDLPGTAAISRSGTIRFPSRPICSRWSAASSAASRTRSAPCPGRDVALRIYVEPGKEEPLRLRHGFAQARHALGRGGVRPRIRSRHLHDRRGVRLQHGRDGEQGPQRLQRQIRAGLPETATDADYRRIEAIIAHEYFHNWTGNRITCRDWFQLCLKEGLTVFRDQEFTADQRSRAVERIARRARPARAPVRRGCGPARPPGAAGALSRDQQLLHGDRLREGRRGRAHAARRCSGRRVSATAWTSTSSATTARPRPSSSSCNASPTRPAPTSRSSCAGIRRPARPRSSATGRYDARAKTYRLELAQTVPPTPGQPTKEPMVIPLAIGLVGRDGRDLPLKFATDGSVERGVLTLTQAGRDLRVHRRRRAAGALAQSRLLGADQARRQPVGRRPAVPRRARQRPVQPLAGAADAGDHAAGRQRRGVARRAARRRQDRGPDRRARRDPRRSRRSSRPSSRWRSPCRAKPTSRARSAAMSTPTRSSRRARALRAAIGERLGPALLERLPAPRGQPALQSRRRRAPAGARCAMSASTCWPRRRAPRRSRSPRGNTSRPTT